MLLFCGLKTSSVLMSEIIIICLLKLLLSFFASNDEEQRVVNQLAVLQESDILEQTFLQRGLYLLLQVELLLICYEVQIFQSFIWRLCLRLFGLAVLNFIDLPAICRAFQVIDIIY